MVQRALRSALRLWIPLVLLRLVYVAQYLQLPFLFGPLFDSQVYLRQAQAVRDGLLGDASLLAFSPLYGYFLAATDAHPGALLPLVLQLLLGLCNVGLVQRITRNLFGERAALWAAISFALYGPLMFFETKIMSETLGLTLLLLAVERLSSPSCKRAASTSASCGVWLSLAVLARASLLFTLPWFALASWLIALREAGSSHQATRSNNKLLRSLRPPLLLVLAIISVLGSYGMLTRAHSGLFVPVILVSNTAAQATSREWRGNLSDLGSGKQAVGAFSVVEQAEERLRALRQGQPDPAASRRGLAGIDIAGWLKQVPSKAALTFQDVETTFDYGFYGERTETTALYVAFATFGLLASLAACGLYLLARARCLADTFALAPVLFGILTVTTLFHPSTRYRLPILVALAPLAGVALAHAHSEWQAQRRVPALAAVGLAALFCLLGTRRGLSQPGMWELRVAESAAMAGDLPECRARVLRAVERQPHDQLVLDRARYVGGLMPACSLIKAP